MLLGLVLLALGVIVFVRSRNHVGHTKIPLPSNLEQLAQNPIFEKSSNDYGNPQLEKWELPRNNIEFINDLADGESSCLFFHKSINGSFFMAWFWHGNGAEIKFQRHFI